MFDVPPLAEIAVSVVVAAAAAKLAFVGPTNRIGVFALWAAASSVILVLLDSTQLHVGVCVCVAITLTAPFRANQRQRWALVAIGIAGVLFFVTRDASQGLRLWSILPALAAGPLFWQGAGRFGEPTTMVLLAGTAMGIYVNVPDTEQIAVHATGLSFLALCMVSSRQLRESVIRFECVALVAVLVVGAGAWGARGRPAAFIGVVGALGVFVAEPVASFLRRGRHSFPLVLITVHAAVVLFVSRLAQTRWAGDELRVVAAAMLIATGLLLVLPRQTQSPEAP